MLLNFHIMSRKLGARIVFEVTFSLTMDAEAVLYTPVLDQNKRGTSDESLSELGAYQLVYVRGLLYLGIVIWRLH